MQHIRKLKPKPKKSNWWPFRLWKTRHINYVHLKKLTKLKKYHVFTTPTGFGSVFLAIFSVTRPGDEIIVSDPVYSPTRILTEKFLKEFNIKQFFIIQMI